MLFSFINQHFPAGIYEYFSSAWGQPFILQMRLLYFYPALLVNSKVDHSSKYASPNTEHQVGFHAGRVCAKNTNTNNTRPV